MTNSIRELSIKRKHLWELKLTKMVRGIIVDLHQWSQPVTSNDGTRRDGFSSAQAAPTRRWQTVKVLSMWICVENLYSLETTEGSQWVGILCSLRGNPLRRVQLLVVSASPLQCGLSVDRFPGTCDNFVASHLGGCPCLKGKSLWLRVGGNLKEEKR